jgi:hypothetical protein
VSQTVTAPGNSLTQSFMPMMSSISQVL